MPKLCRARLTLPSADGQHTVIFECNLGKGHAADATPQYGSRHAEVGKVRGLDGKVRHYTITFSDEAETSEVWRDAKAVTPAHWDSLSNLASND